MSINTLCLFILVHLVAGNARKSSIHDNILTEVDLDELTNFASEYLTWKQQSIFAGDNQAMTFWHSDSYQDSMFSELKSWKSLRKLAMSQLNATKIPTRMWPFGVQAFVLQRGDFPQMQEGHNSSLCTLFVFICETWQNNFYGEMMVFDKSGEYLESIQPRSGRVVLVPRDVQYIVKPPSMNTEQNLMVVLLGVTDTKSLPMSISHPPVPEYNDVDFVLWPRESSWEMSRHVTKKFQMADDKRIVVFDDVFTEDELGSFLKKIDQGFYHYNPPSPDSEDNVAWILGLEVENLLQSELWIVLSQALMVATSTKRYHPYDVSCNNIQSWDHPQVHQDCQSNEDDYTVLIYLTPDWDVSWYGETVFYDGDEIVGVVRPKFGRIVVFHGTIWHSARPPSPLFKGPRYTFAVKSAATKQRAERKMLILSFESLFKFDEELVGEEKASEIHEFTYRLKNDEGEHEEMMELGIKYENELEELAGKRK